MTLIHWSLLVHYFSGSSKCSSPSLWKVLLLHFSHFPFSNYNRSFFIFVYIFYLKCLCKYIAFSLQPSAFSNVTQVLCCIVGNVDTRFQKAVDWSSVALLWHCWTQYWLFENKCLVLIPQSQKYCFFFFFFFFKHVSKMTHNATQWLSDVTGGSSSVYIQLPLEPQSHP